MHYALFYHSFYTHQEAWDRPAYALYALSATSVALLLASQALKINKPWKERLIRDELPPYTQGLIKGLGRMKKH